MWKLQKALVENGMKGSKSPNTICKMLRSMFEPQYLHFFIILSIYKK